MNPDNNCKDLNLESIVKRNSLRSALQQQPPTAQCDESNHSLKSFASERKKPNSYLDSNQNSAHNDACRSLAFENHTLSSAAAEDHQLEHNTCVSERTPPKHKDQHRAHLNRQKRRLAHDKDVIRFSTESHSQTRTNKPAENASADPRFARSHNGTSGRPISASGSRQSLIDQNHHDAKQRACSTREPARKKLLTPFLTHSHPRCQHQTRKLKWAVSERTFFFLFFFFLLNLSVVQTNLALTALTGYLPQTW